MTAEWDDLARLAQAATPGEWEAVGYDDMPHDVVQIGYDDQGDPWATGMIADSVHRPDAEFIAAANPATILRLIEHARQERLWADRWGRQHAQMVAAWQERREERDALAARLAAIEALVEENTQRDGLGREWGDIPYAALRAALAAPTDTTKEN